MRRTYRVTPPHEAVAALEKSSIFNRPCLFLSLVGRGFRHDRN